MSDIDLKIIVALHRKIDFLDKKTSRLAIDYKLTLSQFMVLEALYSKGNMTITEVRNKILSSVGTISLIINNLEKSGYINRLNNPQDKRVSILELTKKGNDLIKEVAKRNEEMIKENLKSLNKEEKEILLNLLKKIGE